MSTVKLAGISAGEESEEQGGRRTGRHKNNGGVDGHNHCTHVMTADCKKALAEVGQLEVFRELPKTATTTRWGDLVGIPGIQGLARSIRERYRSGFSLRET